MEVNVLVEHVELIPSTQAQVVQKAVAIPQTHFIDRAVNVPSVTRRQVPTIQKIQKIVEVPSSQVSTQRFQWKRRRRSSPTKWLTFQLCNKDMNPEVKL